MVWGKFLLMLLCMPDWSLVARNMEFMVQFLSCLNFQELESYQYLQQNVTRFLLQVL